jgi:uncharacterized membrane protein
MPPRKKQAAAGVGEAAQKGAGSIKPPADDIPDKKAQENGEVKTMAEEKAAEKPSSDSNLLAAVGYIIGILAILIFFLKKDDKFARFHALQSVLFNVVFGVGMFVLAIVFTILAVVSGGVLGILNICLLPLGGAAVLYILYCAYMAFTGVMYEMPIIGGFAKKYV